MPDMGPVRPAVWLLLLGAAAASAALSDASPAVRRALHDASVRIEPTGCAGVLAAGSDLVLTARHCIDRESQTLEVYFVDGSTRTARVAATDEVADQVVLVLHDPVPITPLEVVRRRQIPGTVLYFEGNPGRPRFQSARLDHIGRCESLPKLTNALFTSIEGVPGDSGAPLVDAAARVVGLVHGGAHCRIATPGDTLGRLLDHVLDRHLVRAYRGAG
jgi:S1-C subfamily serine protease